MYLFILFIIGAEISLNIDFMLLSAISHLSLKIPLQRMFILFQSSEKKEKKERKNQSN